MGSPAAMDEWMKQPEEVRKPKDMEGMQAWMKWAEDHKSSIVQMGGPLGKTKVVNKSGISDIRNEMGAFSVVTAESHEAAAKMFENHPHFMIFPGDRVEVVEIGEIPKVN